MFDVNRRTIPFETENRERGFTLLEVLVSILITLIVMGAVFGLLTRGQRSFRREPEVADLQQSGRSALDMVARDALQAGAGLPPEFPAFSRLNGAGDQNPDVIEMIGAFQLPGRPYLDPEEVSTEDDTNLFLASPTTNFNVGDMVVVYNDATNDPATLKDPYWALGRVEAVVQNSADPFGTPAAEVTVNFGQYDPQYSRYPQLGAVPEIACTGMAATDPACFRADGRAVMMVRVSAVRYDAVPDVANDYVGPPPLILRRDVTPLDGSLFLSGNPQAVGYLDDFQVAYTIGVTVQNEQDNPPDAVMDTPGAVLNAENMLSGVRITVTARSVSPGMEGASEGASAGAEDDFIRKTFSTNVNPRNLSAGLETRVLDALRGQ